jgi:hypothetical protein
MRGLLTGGLGELRHEPTAKRIRAVLDGGTVVDTTRALLVWEPRRIVPSYAVPADDIAAELAPAGTAATESAGTIGAHVPFAKEQFAWSGDGLSFWQGWHW